MVERHGEGSVGQRHFGDCQSTGGKWERRETERSRLLVHR